MKEMIDRSVNALGWACNGRVALLSTHKHSKQKNQRKFYLLLAFTSGVWPKKNNEDEQVVTDGKCRIRLEAPHI